jgi:hypothetical protein
MTDKKAIRESFDATDKRKFATLDAKDKSLFFLTDHFPLTYRTCVLDMTDESFTEFCKLKYTRRNIRNHNKIRRELFNIADVPESGDVIMGCRVISVQKALNLVYIEFERVQRPAKR